MSTSFFSSASILNWPVSVRPNTLSLFISSSTVSFQSPLSRTTQTFSPPSALFQISASFPALSKTKHDDINVFVAKLRGAAGRFYFPASCCAYGIPSAYEAERVTFIAFTVDSINITCDSTQVSCDKTAIRYEAFYGSDGTSKDANVISGTLYNNSGIAPVKEGGYLSFDDAFGWRHLHLIVGIEKSDGKTLITVEPPMRYQPTAETPIHVHAPSGIFKFTNDQQGVLTRNAGGRSDFSIQAEQAFPVQFTI